MAVLSGAWQGVRDSWETKAKERVGGSPEKATGRKHICISDTRIESTRVWLYFKDILRFFAASFVFALPDVCCVCAGFLALGDVLRRDDNKRPQNSLAFAHLRHEPGGHRARNPYLARTSRKSKWANPKTQHLVLTFAGFGWKKIARIFKNDPRYGVCILRLNNIDLSEGVIWGWEDRLWYCIRR